MINIWGRGFFENTFLKRERFFYGGVEMEGRTMGFAVWCGGGELFYVWQCMPVLPKDRWVFGPM